jgi:hypothetical protein
MRTQPRSSRRNRKKSNRKSMMLARPRRTSTRKSRWTWMSNASVTIKINVSKTKKTQRFRRRSK